MKSVGACWTPVFGIGLIFLATLFGRAAFAQEWRRYGHDGQLTGRSPGRGTISKPEVAWSHALAGRRPRLAMVPAVGDHSMTLSADTAVVPDSWPRAATGTIPLDVEGGGQLRPVAETFHERWAKLLPDVAGLQRVAWNHTWTDQRECRLELFAYDQGFDQPRRVWATDPPEAVIFNPLNIVCDIDGDGVLEVCVAAHYRVMIFEGTTGRKESELRYHASRPYGWFGAVDVDADGQLELVTIGDFQSHIDVLEFDRHRPEPDRLTVMWRRDIEQDIDKREKWPQVGPHPVADVTGDGRPEILVNLFNDAGDQQWHVAVIDAPTGRVVHDLPGRYLQGVHDIDADGVAELFTTSARGVLVHDAGQIELVRLTGPAPTVIWSRSASGWCSADVPRLGSLWSTTASQGMRHVLVNDAGQPAFLVKTWDQEPSRHVVLSAHRVEPDGSVSTVWEVGGLPDSCQVLPIDPQSDNNQSVAIVRIVLPARGTAELVGRDVQVRVLENQPLGVDVSPPIAAKLGRDERLSVISEGPGEELVALSPPRVPGDPPELKWRRPGRGMRDGSRTLGLLAADLDGDGGCEIVAADRAREGHAVLVAYRGDGATMWEKPFEEIPGATPAWNVGALTFWWPGRFLDPNETDLFVNTRRGLMHSDVGQVIRGRDATTVWQRDKARLPDVFHWAWAGAPVATVDMSRDARDDLVCLHPVCFWIADGRSGTILHGADLASRQSLPAWAAYGEPLVHDFDADGQPEVLLDSPYILALLDVTGKPVWHGLGRIDYPVKPGEGNEGQTTPCKHALVDFDGDGSFEIASAGYRDGVRAIDPRSGQVLWSLAAPEPTGPRVTAANIDGRRGDEILFPAGNTLVAVTGDRGSGRILWTWQAPATLSLPAVADVDGDGLLEIIVQDALATLHCLDAGP
ncbi:MAG: hypothetical protein FJ276_07020 [Planctomycetes bacterium]|nr:hypothetical protein [Planctomycetota bacterium]